MDISELEAALSQVEKQLEQLLEKRNPLQEQVGAVDKLKEEASNEYSKKMFEMQQVFQEEQRKIDEQKREAQNEIWAIESSTGKLSNEIRNLREQHAAALKAMAAEERMASIYAKMKDFFEDSPWSAYIKPFQKEDVLAIVSAYEDNKRGILNANVMGAGKTFETGAAYDILADLFYKEHDRKPQVLWLTRKSLVKSTAKELAEWNPDRKFLPIEGNAEMREQLLNIAIRSNIPCISNYEMLNTTPRAMENVWDFIFVDETHKLKGGESVKVFHNVRELTQKARFYLGLSGSPIQNKAVDIWPIFHILDEYRFPSARRFEREFVHEVWDDKKKQFVSKVNEERLLGVMKGQVIKQDPKIVQAAWPDKRRIFEVVEMDPAQRKVYDRIKQGIIDNFKKEIESEPNKVYSITAVIAQLTYLRQVNVWPGGVTVSGTDGVSWNVNCHESAKLDRAVELIEELTGEGEQVVLWSAQFNEPLKEMKRRLSEEFPDLTVAFMTGETQNKRENEEAFQAGEIDVLLCNRSAVSEGFNFQKNPGRWVGGASKAIFLDAWWNPKANEQAEDRIWRTGQSENVDIYYIYTDDSVDAFIAAKLDEKEAMVKGIMDSEVLRPGDLIGMLEDLL